MGRVALQPVLDGATASISLHIKHFDSMVRSCCAKHVSTGNKRVCERSVCVCMYVCVYVYMCVWCVYVCVCVCVFGKDLSLPLPFLILLVCSTLCCRATHMHCARRPCHRTHVMLVLERLELTEGKRALWRQTLYGELAKHKQRSCAICNEVARLWIGIECTAQQRIRSR